MHCFFNEVLYFLGQIVVTMALQDKTNETHK